MTVWWIAGGLVVVPLLLVVAAAARVAGGQRELRRQAERAQADGQRRLAGLLVHEQRLRSRQVELDRAVRLVQRRLLRTQRRLRQVAGGPAR